MTAEEQLAIWAAAPNDEVFVWLQYAQSEDIFVRLGSLDKPNAVGRMRAGDVLTTFQERGSATKSVARDVLSRFQDPPEVANRMRVDEIKGVTCVVVEGRSPIAPHATYRLLLSSVEAFT